MPTPSIRSSSLAALALALAACTSAGGSGILGDPGDQDAGVYNDDLTAGRHRPPADARVSPDAAPPPPDAAPADGGGSTGGGGDTGGGTGGITGIVSCYTEGYPSTTCALPTHCCFSNYSAQHNGECTTSSCTWGTISCDGPEDCANGQHCCAHASIDPDWGTIGYTLACQATACGAAPVNQELCHPSSTSLAGTCSSGSCVTAFGNDNDLPRSLYICK